MVSDKANKAIDIGVILIVLFSLYANLVPVAQSAGDDLNSSNVCAQEGCTYDDTLGCTVAFPTNNNSCARATDLPLNTLFNSSGFVFILLMIGLLLLVIRNIGIKKK